MSKILDALKLSKLTGGINRFVSEASPDQCIDALDVYEREGDLVRRPSYEIFGATAPYLLPHGRLLVVHEDPNGTFTSFEDRAFTFDVDEVSGVGGRIWLGCEIMFAGILWQNVSSTPTEANATNNCLAVPQMLMANYTSGTPSLTPIHGVYDSTRKNIAVGSTIYKQSLWRNGIIAWDGTPRSSSWTTRSLNGGTARYWVALDIALVRARLNETVTPVQFPISAGSFTIGAPGIRAFLLNPVNGLVSTKTGQRSPVIVAGADFEVPRAAIPGGGLAFIRQPDEGPEVAKLIEDEGAGVIGQFPQPNWVGGTTNIGTAGVLTKDDLSYDWSEGQFTEALVATFSGNLSVNNSPTQVCATLSAVTTAGTRATIENAEGFILRCTARALDGPQIGEEREIVKIEASGTDLIVYVYDEFSDTPDPDNSWAVLAPASQFQTMESRVEYTVSDHNADTITPISSSRPFSRAFASTDANLLVNFEIFKKCFYTLAAGGHWSAAYDPITNQTLLTNGSNAILTFDGSQLKILEAVWDTTNGAPGAGRVAQWTGVVRDLFVEGNNPDPLAVGQLLLRRPPDADFIIDYNGRIVTARGQFLRWSAPGNFNDIWPAVYSSQIRDADNDNITGMRTVGDRIAIFTKSSIHLGGPPNERGEISVTPVVQGLGFVSHHAVDNITYNQRSAIMGVTADGLYVFDGADLTGILVDWFQVLEFGVNTRLLNKAVAVFWRQEGLFLAAVPSAGSSVNDRLIVADVANQKLWLWTAPRTRNVETPAAESNERDIYNGITSLARELDEVGTERILIGTRSGLIFTFANGLHDYDGTYIIGKARSKPIVFDDRQHAAVALMVRMESKGSYTTGTYDMNVAVNVSQDGRVRQSESINPVSVALDANYTTNSYDTASTADGSQYSEGIVQTYKVNLETGIKGNAFDFSIRCAGDFRFEGADLLYTLKGQKGIT